MGLQTIYNALRKGGLSRWGALAVMGNLQAESGNEAVRLEGDFDPSRRVSKAYAESVDSGKKTRSTYTYDERGWGLAQWTFWSRKQGLYDLCKAAGKSIGDETCQVQWLFEELKAAKYASLLALLKTCGEDKLRDAVKEFCHVFERPKIENIDRRYDDALSIAKQVKDEEPAPTPTPPKESYWPPRMVDKSMYGPDVALLCGVLMLRGLIPLDNKKIWDSSCLFDSTIENAVKSFQKHVGLKDDGVVGPMTWAALLKI